MMSFLPSSSVQPWDYSWEYAELSYSHHAMIYVLNIYGTEGSEICEIRCELEKGDKTIDDARNRTIAEMGADGWELVSVVRIESGLGISSSSYQDLVLYFKRMIAPEE